MDSVHDALQEANDVDEALREGFRQLPTPSYADESALEDELKALLAEDGARDAVPALPEVPRHRLPAAGKEDDVAARLRRLREGMPA